MVGARSRSLRIKIIWLAAIPTVIVIIAVSGAAYLVYQNTAQQVARERYGQLAGSAARQLDENLRSYRLLLEELAQEENIRSQDVRRQQLALERWGDRLLPFDAGVVVINARDIIVWSQPLRLDWIGLDFARIPEYATIKLQGQAVFSGLVSDESILGRGVVFVGVPFLDSDGSYGGALAGVFYVSYPQLSPIYTELQRAGMSKSSYIYLVDRQGRVLYHPDSSRIGENLAFLPFVERALTGRAGASITRQVSGQEAVFGYAPVASAGWALIVQEDWNQTTEPLRRFAWTLMLALLIGLLAPLALVYIGIGRLLRPLGVLADGAERIARGDFRHQVVINTGDELHKLADDFNSMSRQLAASYANLERKVTERTRELATLNATAATVSRSFDLESVLRDVLKQVAEAVGIRAGAVYLLEDQGRVLRMASCQGCDPELVARVQRLPVGGELAGWLAHTTQTVLAHTTSGSPLFDLVRSSGAEISSLVCAPLRAKGETLGILLLMNHSYREISAEEIRLLTAIGQQISVAIENAQLYAQSRELAIIEERTRLARDLHDSVTQSLFSIGLNAEAIAALLKTDSDRALQQTRRLQEIARDALAEMRSLIDELRPPTLGEDDLPSALERYTQTIKRRYQLPVNLSIRGHRILPREVEQGLYRVAQEALANVFKHAQATQVTIELDLQGDEASLVIQDNGVGFDPSLAPRERRSFGLTSMRERAESLGGIFEVTAQPRQGTRVHVRVPLKNV